MGERVKGKIVGLLGAAPCYATCPIKFNQTTIYDVTRKQRFKEQVGGGRGTPELSVVAKQLTDINSGNCTAGERHRQ